jgi:hypothetical protein
MAPLFQRQGVRSYCWAVCTVVLDYDCVAGLFVTGRDPLKATVIVSLGAWAWSNGTVGSFAGRQAATPPARVETSV